MSLTYFPTFSAVDVTILDTHNIMVDGTPRLDGAMLPGHHKKEEEEEKAADAAAPASAASAATTESK